MSNENIILAILTLIVIGLMIWDIDISGQALNEIRAQRQFTEELIEQQIPQLQFHEVRSFIDDGYWISRKCERLNCIITPLKSIHEDREYIETYFFVFNINKRANNLAIEMYIPEKIDLIAFHSYDNVEIDIKYDSIEMEIPYVDTIITPGWYLIYENPENVSKLLFKIEYASDEITKEEEIIEVDISELI